MSVVGVGIDAIEIARVRTALIRTSGLAARLFTEGERAACAGEGGQPRYGGLAARFAAKEAVGKALGTGIRGFCWVDIEVQSDGVGKPHLLLHGGAASAASDLGVARVHLSLTTSAELALANVVLESA